MDKKLNILAAMALPEKAHKRILKASNQIKLTVIQARTVDDIPDETWEETDILYTRKILPDPEKAPNLKWVHFKYAGIDPFINHPILQSPNIMTTTSSGVITSQTGEYILAAMLAFGQKLSRLRGYQQERKWPRREEKWEELTPVELRHSTVGILGYGSIGRQVARLLQPFGAVILAVKRDLMHPEDTGYTREGMGDPHGDFFKRLYPMEALYGMLRECDFVVAALPLTGATRLILDAGAFEAMKESAYLINVGRGGLIDQKALINALETKRIAGASLDVFEEEPLPEDNPLWGMENVIISPHISGLSQYIDEDTLALFIENLNRYMADLPLHNRVDPTQGY
jgi:phosphoglycerate dehydrogenase-like enzyme